MNRDITAAHAAQDRRQAHVRQRYTVGAAGEDQAFLALYCGQQGQCIRQQGNPVLLPCFHTPCGMVHSFASRSTLFHKAPAPLLNALQSGLQILRRAPRRLGIARAVA